MPAVQRSVRAVLALLVLLVLAGCGDPQPGDTAGGVPGAPIDRQGDAEAVGAPIRVPTVTQAPGAPLDDVRQAIEQRIREQCGGELCVELVVEPRDEELTSCQFAGTEPEPGAWVQRGSTIVLISGTRPCEEPGDEVPAGHGPEGPDEDEDGQQEYTPMPDEPTHSPATP